MSSSLKSSFIQAVLIKYLHSEMQYVHFSLCSVSGTHTGSNNSNEFIIFLVWLLFIGWSEISLFVVSSIFQFELLCSVARIFVFPISLIFLEFCLVFSLFESKLFQSSTSRSLSILLPTQFSMCNAHGIACSINIIAFSKV